MKEEEKKELPQKIEYDLEEHFIYGKQKGWKKVLEWTLTILAWAFLLSYILYLIYGSLAIHFNWYLPEFVIFTREMVLEIQKYFYILFIAALIATIFLIFWKHYNLRRFGRLRRRKFRPPVQNHELADLFEIDIDMIERMQKERHVVLESNIVPKDLGIGNNKEKEKKKKKRH